MTSATIAQPFFDGIRLPDYLAQLIDRFPIPGPEQELELIQKAKRGHETSLTWLMVGHVRLVSKLASKHVSTFEDGQDLLQEGMLGIKRAVEKFDPSIGCKFSTYARSWIQGYIRRYCYRNRPGQLRLPEEKQIHLDKIYKLQSQYPDLELEEIAQKAKLDLDYAEDLLFWGLSFQDVEAWEEFPYLDSSSLDDSDIDDFEPSLETQAHIRLIPAPQIVLPSPCQVRVQRLNRWFRLGVGQFVGAIKGHATRLSQVLRRHPTLEKPAPKRMNLSTWPSALSFSYKNSINTIPSAQGAELPPSIVFPLVKGAFADAQKSLLVWSRHRRDGIADQSGDQFAPAPQQCSGLGVPRRTGRGHLGLCPAAVKVFHGPFASVIQRIRGFTPRDGPPFRPSGRKGAVFESTDSPSHTPLQTFIKKISVMYKTLTALVAVWLGLLISPASAETIDISPGRVHLIDLSASGCRVSKAYMGTRGLFELSLDQPQPQTQKIYLSWKPDTQVESTNLILDFVGCNRSPMELVINRSDDVPKSAITRIGAPAAVASNPRQPVRPSPVAAGQPLTLQPPPKPKTVKRPLPQPKRTATANRFKPRSQVTPSTLVRGLNRARSRGEISFNSDMHKRVNSMVRAMRSGANYQAASKTADVPDSVVQALIQYGQ